MAKDTINKAFIMGRLGKPVEFKKLANGTSVANISVATNERIKDKDVTEWHSIVLFGPKAEIAEKFLHVGSMVLIEGVIRTRSWEDNAGAKHYKTEIIATSMELMGSPREADHSQSHTSIEGSNVVDGSSTRARTPSFSPDMNFDDDIPFN